MRSARSRYRTYRRIEGFILGVFFGLLGAITLVPLSHAGSRLALFEDVALVAVFAGLAIRGFRLGVAQKDNMVSVRTLQWTHKFRRSDVRTFGTEESDSPRHPRSYLVVDLADGRRHVFKSFGGRSDSTASDSVINVVNELNAAWGLASQQ